MESAKQALTLLFHTIKRLYLQREPPPSLDIHPGSTLSTKGNEVYLLIHGLGEGLIVVDWDIANLVDVYNYFLYGKARKHA